MFFDNFAFQCNKKGIAPTAAAIEMGFHRSEVSRWGKGTMPRRANLLKMAAYFDCSIDDLLKDNKKPATKNSDGITKAHQELLSMISDLSEQEAIVLLATAKAQIASRKSQGSD